MSHNHYSIKSCTEDLAYEKTWFSQQDGNIGFLLGNTFVGPLGRGDLGVEDAHTPTVTADVTLNHATRRHHPPPRHSRPSQVRHAAANGTSRLAAATRRREVAVEAWPWADGVGNDRIKTN